MKISELFRDRTVLSFEVFPPKPTSDETVIYKTLEELAKLHPDCVSVTYGAGGGANCEKTVQIASDVKTSTELKALLICRAFISAKATPLIFLIN